MTLTFNSDDVFKPIVVHLDAFSLLGTATVKWLATHPILDRRAHRSKFLSCGRTLCLNVQGQAIWVMAKLLLSCGRVLLCNFKIFDSQTSAKLLSFMTSELRLKFFANQPVDGFSFYCFPSRIVIFSLNCRKTVHELIWRRLALLVAWVGGEPLFLHLEKRVS